MAQVATSTPKKDSKRIFAECDQQTHKLIKIALIEKDETMQEAVITALTQYLGIKTNVEEEQQ